MKTGMIYDRINKCIKNCTEGWIDEYDDQWINILINNEFI